LDHPWPSRHLGSCPSHLGSCPSHLDSCPATPLAARATLSANGISRSTFHGIHVDPVAITDAPDARARRRPAALDRQQTLARPAHLLREPYQPHGYARAVVRAARRFAR